MKKAFLLASLLMILIVILARIQGATLGWAQYQKDFFAEQISKLQIQLETVNDTTQKKEIQQELASYKNRKPEIINLVLPNGQVERCKTCHIGIEEISSSHPSNTVGCAVCHGGNPLSLDKDTAHAGMYGGGHPGSLNVAALSCGGVGANGEACHSGNLVQADNEVDLVKTSIMSTKAGELSVVRMMLGLDKSKEVPGLAKGEVASQYPDPLQGRLNETAFQQNCLSQCHLNGGNLPLITSTDSLHQGASIQANGCEACHVLTNSTHTYVGADTTMTTNNSGLGMVHSLTTQIPYTQCNQCHNQGNQDLLKLTFTARSDISQVVSDWKAGTITWLERLRDYYLPGEVFARCEVSLDCIDCHTRQDVMGDNTLHTSEYDAVNIQCQDCHGTTERLPQTKKIENPNDLAFEEQTTNSNFPALKIGDEILMTTKGEELPFLRHIGNTWILSSRVTGETFKIPIVFGSKCQQSPTEQGADSCHKCHDSSALHP